MKTKSGTSGIDLPAVDLDGVIFRCDKWDGPGSSGKLKEGCKEVMEYFAEKDDVWIVIWTCRNNADLVKEKLNESGIPFDSVNSHPWEPENISRKMPCDLLIDDRVFPFSGSWHEIKEKVKEKIKQYS
ncbi:hypothetical protein AKJ57_03470 [candidate division MSBL1 archaeon SCGC-AAA259A05]|uniref:FCP1 homology domain-containing protein n=1 Tax=candidate division MSBL1 archaeon SCGC-AAA259A05 TaxID=1698259 RepID=A0A133U9J8_9EURY|nr:hypothetical protein AKJ57_03470 [candidate division MSBL1 archaeon SCGC-AAA259A05]